LPTIASHDDPLTGAEERAFRTPSKKKNPKFKGKSDAEMKMIRQSIILSTGHTTTKETTVDGMYSYLAIDDDLNDLTDWVVIPDSFIPHQ
jgi:hypothetical protein